MSKNEIGHDGAGAARVGWCPSSGQNVGLMIESVNSDDWQIECPTCGMKWHGGSTVLSDHHEPRSRM